MALCVHEHGKRKGQDHENHKHRTGRKHRARQEAAARLRECLQHTLDGYDGTNSEIEEYVRVLQHFAD